MFRPSSNIRPVGFRTGLSHRGFAVTSRQAHSDFGSPWTGLAKIFRGMSSTGLVRGRPMAGLKSGYVWGFRGAAPFIVPLAAFSASQAPRGYALSTAAGDLSGYGLAGLAGGFVAGPLGALAAQFLVGDDISRFIARGVQSFSGFDSRIRRLEMGGDFRDSQAAYTMRQRAAIEMSQSLLNARSFLGSESVLLHS